MPLYASPEQLLRERSEIARRGISRGRSVIVLSYAGGVLFIAQNPSTTLHKISEIYDRIGFAAAGRYSEYESLRQGGIRHVDVWGYSYDRRDVSARHLANVYAQTLASMFTEQIKPAEVEICLAQVGPGSGTDELYRLTYDGSINDEPGHLVMGGQTEPIANRLKELYSDSMELRDAVHVAVQAFDAAGAGQGAAGRGANGEPDLGIAMPNKLEVAVLERDRPHRAFRRVRGAALSSLLPEQQGESAGSDSGAGAAE
jgi:proteasome alpha subunit